MMLPQQTPYTASPNEVRPEMQPPAAQRLMPRLMPEIMYNLRSVEPERAHNKAFGMSLALAIVSVVVMIPLTAIVVGVLATSIEGGIVPALIGLGIVGLVVLIINVWYNYVLFFAKK